MSDLLNRSLLAIGITTASACVVIYLYKKSRYWSCRGLNGPRYIPLLNDVRRIFMPLPDIYAADALRYGSVYGTFSKGRPTLVISDPTLIELMLIRDAQFFTDRSVEAEDHWSQPVFSGGAFAHSKHAALARTLSSKKTKRLHERMSIITDRLLSHLTSSDECDLRQMSRALVFDVLCRIFYSAKKAAIDETHTLCTRFWQLLGFSVGSFDHATFFLDGVRDALRMRTTEWPLTDTLPNIDCLQFLLSDQSSLTKREICQLSALFFRAAFEPTVALVALTLYHISRDPRIQTSLVEELMLNRVRRLTCDQIMCFNYLDQLVNEVLRTSPPVTKCSRVASADYELSAVGLLVRRGTVIEVPVSVVHTNPEYWPDPYVFDPSRFQKRDVHTTNCSFIPFGIELNRSCVGARFAVTLAKVLVAKLIQKFEFRRLQGGRESVRILKLGNYLDFGPIYVSMRRRSDNSKPSN